MASLPVIELQLAARGKSGSSTIPTTASIPGEFLFRSSAGRGFAPQPASELPPGFPHENMGYHQIWRAVALRSASGRSSTSLVVSTSLVFER